jgi:hypothetical protein
VSLDIQYFDGFTDPTPNLYYSTSDDGVFLTWLSCHQPAENLTSRFLANRRGIEDHPKKRPYKEHTSSSSSLAATMALGKRLQSPMTAFVGPIYFPSFPQPVLFSPFMCRTTHGTMVQAFVQLYEPRPACPMSPARYSDFVSTASRTQVARRLHIFSSSRLALSVLEHWLT